jgi:hypothetical protein
MGFRSIAGLLLDYYRIIAGFVLPEILSRFQGNNYPLIDQKLKNSHNHNAAPDPDASSRIRLGENRLAAKPGCRLFLARARLIAFSQQMAPIRKTWRQTI